MESDSSGGYQKRVSTISTSRSASGSCQKPHLPVKSGEESDEEGQPSDWSSQI